MNPSTRDSLAADVEPIHSAERDQRPAEPRPFSLSWQHCIALAETARQHGASEAELAAIVRLQDFQADLVDVERLEPLAAIAGLPWRELFPELNKQDSAGEGVHAPVAPRVTDAPLPGSAQVRSGWNKGDRGERPAAFHQCSCGATYDRDDWAALDLVGYQPDVPGTVIEGRNCRSCGSTRFVEIPASQADNGEDARLLRALLRAASQGHAIIIGRQGVTLVPAGGRETTIVHHRTGLRQLLAGFVERA